MEYQNADQTPTDVIESRRAGAGLAYAAFATGALALSIPAIALGHVSLGKTARSRSSARAFALAGTILGYVGLVATAAAVYLIMFGPHVQATQDAQVQADVIAVGSALAEQVIASDDQPAIRLNDTSITVGSTVVERTSTVDTELEFSFTSGDTWCVSLTSPGSEAGGYSYMAQTGMVEGLRCTGSQ